MPFVDVPESIGAIPPLQIAGDAGKTGVIEPEFTVCTIVVVVAHCPPAGVKV